jgi:cellulose synthase/poly-beta-1,6-N-acetylglucosamine synthase-like glycosyltransferase
METSSQPKISVIVPLCNAQATVMTALHSLLQQTWRNIEVLVVDDCSSDGGFELVCEVAKQDDRLVLLRHMAPTSAPMPRATPGWRAPQEISSPRMMRTTGRTRRNWHFR